MNPIRSPAARFAGLLAGPGIVPLAGCYDAFSAMALEDAGFPAIFLSGYGVAASRLGNPDIGLTPLVETALCARNVARRIRAPLVVDVDNGYGEGAAVARTVSEMERAGAAAIVMEDQVAPKKCGHSEGKRVVPLSGYLRKLERALKARRTALLLIARTDAGPIEEAIARAKAFHSAGADVTAIDGIRSVADMRRFVAEVPGLKQVNLIYGGKTPLLPAAELGKLGFKIVLYSTPALYLVAGALSRWLRVLRKTGDLASVSGQSVDFRRFQAFIEKRYQAAA